jgi:predicted RNase H-like nuclease
VYGDALVWQGAGMSSSAGVPAGMGRPPGPVRVLGVDGCPGGWVAVELADGAFTGARFAAELRTLVDTTTVAVVAVDMPLGLRDEGWRAADHAARAVLGPRRASVFLVPPRSVWQHADFAAANAHCRLLTGSGLTQQTWGLRHKVLEADALRERMPGRLYEVHPEVAFAAMAVRPRTDPAEAWFAMVAAGRETGDLLPGDVLAADARAVVARGAVPGVPAHAPLAYAKTTWAGAARRRALLRAAGIVLPDDLGPANPVPPVDVLDAAAVAWSAHRIATDQAGRLPPAGPAQLDDRAEPIVIWY